MSMSAVHVSQVNCYSGFLILGAWMKEQPDIQKLEQAKKDPDEILGIREIVFDRSQPRMLVGFRWSAPKSSSVDNPAYVKLVSLPEFIQWFRQYASLPEDCEVVFECDEADYLAARLIVLQLPRKQP